MGIGHAEMAHALEYLQPSHSIGNGVASTRFLADGKPFGKVDFRDVSDLMQRRWHVDQETLWSIAKRLRRARHL